MIRKNIIQSKLIGDHYYAIDHPKGLKIFLYPKENSKSTYAIFGTHYGSVDTCFRRSDESDVCKVPEGIAHFLEHKLFENEDCDAFEKYARTGASANAYTSFDMTCYLFSCTDHLYDSLEILLDFVQKPYFTKETIDKELGIIGQEIKMYDDDPGWRVMFNLLGALYKNHPVKIDIAGTVESIAQITPDLLYRCYNTFYNLHNMVLCIAGNFDLDKVVDVIDRMLLPCDPIKVEKYFEPESREIVQQQIVEELSVSVPLFQLGYKENVLNQRISTENLVAAEIVLEILASDSSDLFRELLDKELINEASFGYELFEGPGYAVTMFSGESKNPEKAAKIIRERILELKKTGISSEDFERAKRSIYGRNVAALNSPETISNAMVSLYFAGRELYSYLETVANLSLEKINEILRGMMDDRYCAVSIINPIRKSSEKGENI